MFDYTRESYADSDRNYDLIVDNVGNLPLSANRARLRDGGRYVAVGGEKGNWIAPLKRPLAIMFQQPFVEHELVSFVASIEAGDLAYIAELMAEGKLTPVLDQTRSYTLEQTPEAIAYVEKRHARGKVIVTIE